MITLLSFSSSLLFFPPFSLSLFVFLIKKAQNCMFSIFSSVWFCNYTLNQFSTALFSLIFKFSMKFKKHLHPYELFSMETISCKIIPRNSKKKIHVNSQTHPERTPQSKTTAAYNTCSAKCVPTFGQNKGGVHKNFMLLSRVGNS